MAHFEREGGSIQRVLVAPPQRNIHPISNQWIQRYMRYKAKTLQAALKIAMEKPLQVVS